MTQNEIFALFFSSLLTLDNRQQARDLARKAWPATHDMWLHSMKIDDILIELELAQVMGDGRIGYLMPDNRNLGWRDDRWEIEVPTPEQETKLRATAEQMLVAHELRVVLQDGSKVSWDDLKRLAVKDHVWFQIFGSENNISFRMGPDHFPDSFVLAWMTLKEKEGGPDAYQDNRCRSAEPDDFLSRIHHLASGAEGEFVPKW